MCWLGLCQNACLIIIIYLVCIIWLLLTEILGFLCFFFQPREMYFIVRQDLIQSRIINALMSNECLYKFMFKQQFGDMNLISYQRCTLKAFQILMMMLRFSKIKIYYVIFSKVAELQFIMIYIPLFLFSFFLSSCVLLK